MEKFYGYTETRCGHFGCVWIVNGKDKLETTWAPVLVIPFLGNS